MKNLILFLFIFIILTNVESMAHPANDTAKTACDTGSNRNIQIELRIGGSLVRNTLAPEWSAGFELKTGKDYYTRLNVSSLYFFERNVDRKFKMYDNYFVSADLAMFDKEEKTFHKSGGGIGYLFSKKGEYFSGTTMKFYYFRNSASIEIMPFFIFTNDFKTAFPGISVTF